MLRESLSVSPMDMDVGADLILGWDKGISRATTCNTSTCSNGHVRSRSGPARLQFDLLPAGTRPAARALEVIGHGEFRRLLRQLASELPAGAAAGADAAAATGDAPSLDGRPGHGRSARTTRS